MIRLLVVADDFTGALDTGVQFSKQGIATRVSIYPDIRIQDEGIPAPVWVVDTQSRHLSADAAYQRVYDVCCQGVAAGFTHFYKKTDSTLRGNIGAELAALMDAVQCRSLPFIPAYPRTGRTTRAGSQYVDGIPLDRTIFAQDPLNPVKDHFIPNIISGGKWHKKVRVIRSVTEYDSSMGSDMAEILVFDGEEQADLERVGARLASTGQLAASAGCAGFAEILSRMTGLNPGTAIRETAHDAAMPVLVVCGSVNETSLRQAHYAQKAGLAHTTLCLSAEGTLMETVRKEQIKRIQNSLKQGGSHMIKTAEDVDAVQDLLRSAAQKGLEREEMHAGIIDSIATMVRETIAQCGIRTLVVFGGDTALGIIGHLGCTSLLPRGELMPGVVVSEVMGGSFQGTLITKAGGFGQEEDLQQIMTIIGKDKTEWR